MQAYDRFKVLPLEVRELFRSRMASYMVSHEFLSQLVDYDNPDLERLHAYSKSLLPRLVGKTEGGELLDGAARLAIYKVAAPNDHKLSLEGSEAKPMKPMGVPGQTWEDPIDRLSAIIKKMNEIFSGTLTEGDFTGFATTLLAKLEEDATLSKQAQANDTVEAFSNGAYETKLNNAVVAALQSHSSMADQSLKHALVFKGLANALVGEAYLRLRAKGQASGESLRYL